MPQGEDRRRFLQGAAIGAIGVAAGVATDIAGLKLPAATAAPSAPVSSAAVSEKTRSVVSEMTAPATSVVNVKDLGARGDGRTDDSAAFAAAVHAAARSSRLLPYGLSPDPVGSVVIDIPPGTYVIKRPGAFLGGEQAPTKINGLRWRGAGSSITTIVFAPPTGAVMLQNDLWQNLQLDSISFVAERQDCTFLLSRTTHNAQRYLFVNCSWSNFKYGFDLRGDNNNSEYVFLDCHTSGHQDDGVFFFIGATDTSDQFVNYWFFGCTHWSTSAPFIDAAKGGQFQIYGLDASDFGRRLTAPGYLIRLRGAAHGLGVCQLVAHGLRVEGKSSHAGLLRSEWPQGQVSFHNVDWTSQIGSVRYGDIIRIDYANADGPVYSFHECQLAGGVAVTYSINDWAHDHRIAFFNCTWSQRSSPTDVVHYTGPAQANGAAQPPVRFEGCRGGGGNPLSVGGAYIWDAVVGYRGQVSQTLQPRVVSVRGPNGVSAGEQMIVNLPVGAIVTGFEVMGASGAVSSYASPTWTLVTSDGHLVATAAAGGPAAAGYRAKQELISPFLCRTASQARLVLRVRDADQNDSGALLLVHGYW